MNWTVLDKDSDDREPGEKVLSPCGRRLRGPKDRRFPNRAGIALRKGSASILLAVAGIPAGVTRFPARSRKSATKMVALPKIYARTSGDCVMPECSSRKFGGWPPAAPKPPVLGHLLTPGYIVVR